MPERFFHPEFEQITPPDPEEPDESGQEAEDPEPTDSSPQQTVSKKPSGLHRTTRTAATALVGLAAMAAESKPAQAYSSEHPTPRAAPTTEFTLPRSAKKSSKPATNPPLKKAGIIDYRGRKPNELNALLDKGLAKEIAAANRYKLGRVKSEKDLEQMIKSGQLRRVPDQGRGFRIDPHLGTGRVSGSPAYEKPENLKYAAPEVVTFITKLGQEFEAAFPGRKFTITSMVRTPKRQAQISGVNPNTAKGGKSSHMREGIAFDILKQSPRYDAQFRLTSQEVNWMWNKLRALENSGVIQASDESSSNALHVFVIPKGRSTTSPQPPQRTLRGALKKLFGRSK